MKLAANFRLKPVEDFAQLQQPRKTASDGLGLPIELDAVSKNFGERAVLKSASLAIAATEFVAVVGRSGCGKTTLLRLITGLDPSSQGVVKIASEPVQGLQGRVRLLFQDPRLLMWQTVEGNVGIAREPGWRETARQALQDVGLADRARDWPSVLPAGRSSAWRWRAHW